MTTYHTQDRRGWSIVAIGVSIVAMVASIYAETVTLDVPVELLEPMQDLVAQAEARLAEQDAPPAEPVNPAQPTGKTWRPGERFVLGRQAAAVTILRQGAADKLPGGHRADVGADDDISDMLDWARPGPHYAIVVGLDGEIQRPPFTVLAGDAQPSTPVVVEPPQPTAPPTTGRTLTHDDVQAMLDRGGRVELPAGATIRTSGFVLRRPGTTVTTAGDGPRARVVLQLDGAAGSAFSVLGNDRRDIGIDRLDISVEGRDGGRLRATGFTSVAAGARGLFVTDCVIAGFADGVVIQGLYEGQDYLTRVIDPVVDPVIRGNVIRDIYAGHGSGHSQGIFANSTVGLQVVGNTIYRTGWAGDRNSEATPATKFNQAIYIYSTCVDTRVTDNVVLQASSHGLQLRGGGWATGNHFAQNPLGIAAYGETVEVSRNVIDRCGDINAANPRGLAIEHKLVGSARTIDNIAQNKTGGATWYGVVQVSDDNWRTTTDGVQRNGTLRVNGNKVYRYPVEEWVGIPVQNNNERVITEVNAAGNVIDDPAWADPGRTLLRYVREVMGEDLADDEAATVWFVDQAVADDARAAAEPLNAWIRAGYDRGPPAPLPTPDPTPIAPRPTADAGLEILPGAPNADPWLRGRTLVVRLHGRHQHGPAEAAEVRWTDTQGRAILGAIATPPGAVELWLRDWQTLPDDTEGHTWWAGTAGADGNLDLWMERAVVGITRAVEAHYGTSGRVLHGISMGGGGALRIGWGGRRLGMDWDAVRADVPALLHSDHSDHGGVRGVDRLDGVIGRDLTGAEIDRLDVRRVARERGASLPPTWISYGTADPSVSPASIVELVEVARAAGASLTVHRGEGEGHRAGQPGSDEFEASWRGAF